MGVLAPPLKLPAPGDIIGGKYRVLQVIGEGGMGIVFEATHVGMAQRVAIKILQPSVLASPEIVSRFEREARAAGRLRGRNVARVFDVEVLPGKLPFMVMELLQGQDLAAEIGQRGTLPVEEAIDYLLQACAGIAEAHEAGIIHRDLKPSNLFLSDEDNRRIVKLLDFGISKIMGEASRLTSTSLAMGTPLYMSPEQVRSSKTVDARADIWALGVILYELLAGQPPFVGSGPFVAAAIVTDDPPPLRRQDVPAELTGIMHKALAKKADDRFVDVRTFAAAIAPFGPLTGSLGRIPPAESSSRRSLPRPSAGLENAVTEPGGLEGPANPRQVLTLEDPGESLAPAGTTAPAWSTGSQAKSSSKKMRLLSFAITAAGLAVAVAFWGAFRSSASRAMPAATSSAQLGVTAPPPPPAVTDIPSQTASAAVASSVAPQPTVSSTVQLRPPPGATRSGSHVNRPSSVASGNSVPAKAPPAGIYPPPPPPPPLAAPPPGTAKIPLFIP